MAGLRWFPDAKKSLSGATYIVDVESCRSIAGTSCYGREQRIPTNAYAAIRAVKQQLDVVVLMAGTHNEQSTVDAELRSIKKLVEKRGAKFVVLTLRKSLRPNSAVRKTGVISIDRVNGMIKKYFSHTKSDSTYVADWKTFSNDHSNWFRQDGIHLNIRGALALGWYVSHVVAHVLHKPCGTTDTAICTIPVNKDSFEDWLHRFNVEYTDMHCYEDGNKRIKMCERDRRMP
jgi:hypothetical protein